MLMPDDYVGIWNQWKQVSVKGHQLISHQDSGRGFIGTVVLILILVKLI